jgi:hypothetical protein
MAWNMHKVSGTRTTLALRRPMLRCAVITHYPRDVNVHDKMMGVPLQC